MRPNEMDALIEQGVEALEAALASGGLSEEETATVQRAIERWRIVEAREASEETPAEEPDEVEDSEPEPKAEAKPRRSTPSRSAGKKGK